MLVDTGNLYYLHEIAFYYSFTRCNISYSELEKNTEHDLNKISTYVKREENLEHLLKKSKEIIEQVANKQEKNYFI